MNISLENISFAYQDKIILKDFSFTFEAGHFYVVRGESGCGKSTLTRIMAYLINVDSGEICRPENVSIVEWRRKVQLLPQTPVMFPGSVKENLLVPFSFGEYRQKQPAKQAVDDVIGRLLKGIDLEQEASSLSQGQKQRLALSRQTCNGRT